MSDPSSEPEATLQRRWKNLLTWLEGHGFQAQNLPVECRETTCAGKGLFARKACTPTSLLFAIPPQALMNKMTLRRSYPLNIRVPAKALSATQLISMHLFIWRPKAEQDSEDPLFGPYISALPKNFDSHPLTWLVLSKVNKADDLRASLLNSLPPSILVGLHRLYTRFWDDWCKVREFLKKTSSTMVPTHTHETLDAVIDFLWAWLNVNTRCIYYRLKQSKADPDNLTMCPILDFANHTPSQAHMIPVPSKSEIWNVAPVNSIGDGLKFMSPDNVTIEENDEILLTYGPHSNKTMFVEYGFVNGFGESGPSPSGEVDVQDLAERIVFTDPQPGERVKAVLIEEGYWGDWTLHSTPDGAQPSWRLVTALRLYHFVVATGSANEDTIQTWRDVTMGKRRLVSLENEQSWRKAVVLLCNTLMERAEKSITLQHQVGGDAWTGWMSQNIQSLWKEEMFVARAVKESILRGNEF